jgi:hypothetical protein
MPGPTSIDAMGEQVDNQLAAPAATESERTLFNPSTT